MNNLLSYRGLDDAKIRASDKDLPVKAQNFSFSTDHTENQRKNCPLTSVIVSLILWMPCILTWEMKIVSEI